jgi:hypothetical protein
MLPYRHISRGLNITTVYINERHLRILLQMKKCSMAKVRKFHSIPKIFPCLTLSFFQILPFSKSAAENRAIVRNDFSWAREKSPLALRCLHSPHNNPVPPAHVIETWIEIIDEVIQVQAKKGWHIRRKIPTLSVLVENVLRVIHITTDRRSRCI